MAGRDAPVGDLDAARTSLRFDERMTLKEDYDYTAQHLHEHGAVARSNRVFITATHCARARARAVWGRARCGGRD